MANYEWVEKEPLVIIIDGETIDLEVKGVAYARQFGKLTSWLGKYALPALLSAAESGDLENASNVDMLSSLIGSFFDLGFTPESMVELGSILLDKDEKFVEEHFDPGWFIEVLLVSYDYKPGIRKAFVKLYERFFLAAPADSGDEAYQASD